MFTNKEIADTNELGTFQKVNKTNGPLRSLAERGAHSGAVLTPHLDRTGSGFERVAWLTEKGGRRGGQAENEKKRKN